MSKLPESDPHPQEHAVRIISAALTVLRTRDGIPISDELIIERSRNAVAGLAADYDLIPRSPGLDGLGAALAALHETNGEFRATCAGVGELLAVTR